VHAAKSNYKARQREAKYAAVYYKYDMGLCGYVLKNIIQRYWE
jgi:hypothetical protein